MVKNTKGGSGHKSQARKFANGNTAVNAATRFSQDEYEYYAQVVATLGNGMCHVMCQDGKKRLCHIRGKFRGRSMRDNMIKNGVWVLVGGRDYEVERSKDDKKLEKCDLLEVYTDLDKERLKSMGGFSDFISRDHTFANTQPEQDDLLEFTDNAAEDDYLDIMKKSTVPVCNKNINDDEEVVNVDDI